MKHAQSWIDGRWIDSAQKGESINPSSNQVLGTFADSSRSQVEEGIAAARRAFEQSAWAHKPRLRSSVLLAMADALEKQHHELAWLLAAENGKPISSAHHEVAAGFKELRYYAGLTRTIFGRVSEIDDGLYAMLAREPLGVTGIIVPWNAPATLLVRSLAPALAAGCTTVVKAAHQSSLLNHAIYELLVSVEGVPAGVLNMFTESGHEGAKLLVASPEVDIISYTGSTHVGKLIMRDAASTLKRISLELGGSAPVVIFEDADLDKMAPDIAKAGTAHTGQMCTAASRVIVHESRVDEAQAKLSNALQNRVMGVATEKTTQMGPMIDNANRDRIDKMLSEAATTDEIILRGSIPTDSLANGAFISPSLISVGSTDSPLLRDEVFGPALSIDTFGDEAEAISKANNTRFGLAASVWSADMQRAQRVSTKIKAGTVWINGHNRLMAEAETGGYRESGIGRLHGVEGLESFLQTKHISWHLNE